jgi:uncharacterized protein YecT (DUF1311 family)
MERLQPTLATLKALFAKSGNCCAFPNCRNHLVDDLNILVAEVCHINAVAQKDARYDPEKTAEELRGYDNLVLLCHPHHRRVDARADLYPAHELKRWKLEHERSTRTDGFMASEQVLAEATLQIVHDDWTPDLSCAADLLYEGLKNAETQGDMNYTAAAVSEVLDAQLLVTYTQLFQALSPSGRLDLYNEQGKWRQKRFRYASKRTHLGSMAALDFAEARSTFTRRRIAELERRIKSMT